MIQDILCMSLWESPLNNHSSESSTNLISLMEFILSQQLNLKDKVSNVFIYKMGAIKGPTRKANTEAHITVYNMVLSLADHTNDQFLLKFLKHLQVWSMNDLIYHFIMFWESLFQLVPMWLLFTLLDVNSFIK